MPSPLLDGLCRGDVELPRTPHLADLPHGPPRLGGTLEDGGIVFFVVGRGASVESADTLERHGRGEGVGAQSRVPVRLVQPATPTSLVGATVTLPQVSTDLDGRSAKIASVPKNSICT